MIKIYIEGAESTGKSTLAFQLANEFNAEYLPEYGRIYLENYYGTFDYKDVETVASTQILLEKAYKNNNCKILFIDTSLINTKQWFLYDYQKCPQWVENEIKNYKNHLFLFCNTDLPWIADGIRGNGGTKREELQKKYKDSLMHYEIPHFDIIGTNENRFNLAKKYILNYLKKLNI